MTATTPDPLGLFLHAHLNGVREAERCLGVIEKLLLKAPRDSLLMGCKAALLLIVQGEIGLARNDRLYRRTSLQMVQSALARANIATKLQIRLMNGVAWARLRADDADQEQAISFLRAIEAPYQRTHIPDLMALEGLVALSVAYQDQGKVKESAERFQQACAIDRMLASNRYEFFSELRAQRYGGRLL